MRINDVVEKYENYLVSAFYVVMVGVFVFLAVTV
jgi:hypothetical protein